MSMYTKQPNAFYLTGWNFVHGVFCVSFEVSHMYQRKYIEVVQTPKFFPFQFSLKYFEV